MNRDAHGPVLRWEVTDRAVDPDRWASARVGRRRWSWRWFRLPWALVLLMSPLAALVLVAWVLGPRSNPDPGGLVHLVVIAGVVVATTALLRIGDRWAARRIARAFASTPGAMEPFVLTATSEGTEIERRSGTEVLPWSAYRFVTTADGVTVLSRADGSSQFPPTEALTGTDDAESVERCLAGWISQARTPGTLCARPSLPDDLPLRQGLLLSLVLLPRSPSRCSSSAPVRC